MPNLSNTPARIEIVELQANRFTFRCRTCGMSNSGDPVILLHGLPETSHMWTKVLQSLAAQGYRCLAPDLAKSAQRAKFVGLANMSLHYSLRVNLADRLNEVPFS